MTTPKYVTFKKNLVKICILIAALTLAACGGGGGGGSNNTNGSSSSSSTSSTSSNSSSSSSSSSTTSSSGSSTSSSSSSGVVMQRSPDWLVFTADKEVDGLPELYATLDDGSIEPIKLSAFTETLRVGSSLVSPDGEYVVFHGQTDTTMDGNFDPDDGPFELYRAPVDGSEPAVKISGTINSYTNIDGVSWSPQSNQLVFRADVEVDGTSEIYLVTNDTATPIKINGNTAGIVEIGDTHWSPDGRYLAQFVLNKTQRYISDRQAINVYDTTLGEPNSTRMTGSLVPGSTYDQATGWAGANISHMRWAPDSSRIVYMLDDHRTGNQRSYWQAYPDGVNENVTSTLAENENGGLNYEWSPNSRYLAYEVVTSGLGANIIEIFDREDGSHHRVVTAPNGGRTQRTFWRPNSNQFLLTMSLSSDSPMELFLFDVSDENVANPVPLVGLNEGESLDYNMRWSDSGERLAFMIRNSDTNTFSVNTINPGVETTPVQISPVLDGSGESEPYTWLASNDSLMFGHASGHFLAEADQSNTAQILNGALDVYVEIYTNSFRAIGEPSPHLRIDTAGTVAFLANSPENGNITLYTAYEDGSTINDIAGDMVEGGDVSSFSYAKISD